MNRHPSQTHPFCGLLLACLTFAAAVLTGCATSPPLDQTAFKAARPASILVLPPVNQTTDVKATHSVYAQTSQPLAEAGYYVMPVALVEETFRQNGLTQPDDIHVLPIARLRDIFGADAVLYMTIKRYGATYMVVASDTVVEAHARLVDARSGEQLWEGSARASSSENRNQNSGGLAGLLLTAVLQQIISTTTDHSHTMAGIANRRLLAHTSPNGLLPGPRRPSVKP
jgi:hypothetical protein